MRSDPDFVAEIFQAVRVDLFTGVQPRAASFTDRSPLAAWLKVVGAHAALDKLRAEGRAHARERCAQFLSSRSSTGLDRRLDRRRYAAALGRALQRLSARDRNVLRLRYASQLNLDAVGLAYGVHRATVARWIGGALRELGRTVRAQFERGPERRSPSELDSALRGMESQLASALGSFLEASRAEPVRR